MNGAPVRFSPMGNPVLSVAGLWWELETPVYKARLPLPWKQAATLDCGSIPVDWNARAYFTLKTPRIPARLLAQAAAFFTRELLRSGGQIESLAWLTWSGAAWDLVVPEQTQCAYRVESTSIRANDQVGMVLHSHGKLPAFFSKTDDESEADGFLYGVLGGLDPGNPKGISFCFRAGHAGCFLPLSLKDFFDV